MLDKSIIIFEDADLLVIDKPAGVIVNRATSHHQYTLQDFMVDYLSLPPIPADLPVPDEHASREHVFAFRQGLVHRLDKDTSGLILWAKNPDSLANLLSQFQQRTVHKTYLCLTHGLWRDKSGRLTGALARKPTNRQIMAVVPDGRPAVTLYQVTQEFPHFATDKLLSTAKLAGITLHRRDIERLYQGFSLVEMQLLTGRTHQIRAHATNVSHPLVGDTNYLPRRKARLDPLWCPRQFLHAQQLSFTHPTSGEPLTFTTPLPADLRAALTWLQP